MPTLYVEFFNVAADGSRNRAGGAPLAIASTATAAGSQITTPAVSGRLEVSLRSDAPCRVDVAASPAPSGGTGRLVAPGFPDTLLGVAAGLKIGTIATVYARDLEALGTGAVATQGSSPTFGNTVNISGPAGTDRGLLLQSNGVTRWALRANNGAESGGSAGSTFFITRANDAGGLVENSLAIDRATGLTTLTSLSVTGTATFGGGTLSLTNGTSNTLAFAANGVGVPTAGGTRSSGTKVLLYPDQSGANGDFAMGIGPSLFWSSVANNTHQWGWYAAATSVATLTGTGHLSVAGTLRPASYTVATLPTAGTAGRTAWASNGRAYNGAGTLQGAGAGTGALVTDDGTAWRVAGTNQTVQA